MVSEKLIVLCLIYLGFCTEILCQNAAQVTYIKTKPLVSVGMNSEDKASNYVQKIPYLLTFKDSLASYVFITPTKDKNENASKAPIFFTKFEYPFFYNLNSKQVYRKKGKYLLTRKFDQNNWYLTGDMQTIKGLTSYKATTSFLISRLDQNGNVISEYKEPVVAWYTTDICIALGPDGFAGLPGLIVKLEIHNEMTELENITFNPNTPPIKLPPYKVKMTEAEFETHQKEIIAELNN